MKKLLNILGSLVFTTSTVATVVACSSELSSSNTYKDSEIENIKNKNIVSQVRATSQLAKIMIGGRHENGNYNSVPMYSFFNGSAPLYKLDNGHEVDFSVEKNDLQALQPELKDNSPIDGPTRRPESSYHYVKDFHNKGLVREGKTYNYNDNYWSFYDTGALTNYTMLNNEAMNEMFLVDSGDFNHKKKGASYLTEALFNNGSFDYDTNKFEYLSTEGELISYGKESSSALFSSYQKSALGIVDLLISSIQSFGQGNEFITLSGLNNILPILKTSDVGIRNNFGLILSIVGLAHGTFKVDWFPRKIEESPLTELGVDLESEKAKELIAEIKKFSGLTLAVTRLASDPSKTSLYDNNDVDIIMKETIRLSEIYRDLFELSKDTFNEQGFNELIGNMISNTINLVLSGTEIINVEIYPQTKAFLTYFAQAFKSENFPTWKILSFLGNMFNPLFIKDEDENYNYIKNVDLEKDLKYIYEYSESDYNPNIQEIDPTSNYGKEIKRVLGLVINEDGSESYKPDSVFDSIDDIANNPDNFFYQAIQEAVYSNDGYYGKLFASINEGIEKSWFDLVFMDKNWDIKADGIGVNNTKLGLFNEAELKMQNGKVEKTSSITYQLDYYGPKDESTDLSLHENEINYNSAKNIPDFIKNLSQEEQMKYDGTGDKYMENSDQIKYSYIVTIANVSSNTSEQNWKFVDFEWYYNNQRYY
ncbi:lipoprotein [Spiroplasma endosymbiont of Anurida maritima]|uniref:lipoprotein n=1 Tax=Spiroplasma endosymbiont of Anurida maritima TaxID=2967972 RepID=UPI0036D3433F